jgi:D-arabinonate dehydratase/D-galactarolactone cycloisomerase
MKITDVRIKNLVVEWADLFGDISKVPYYLLHPSANFSGENPPRLGQFSTLIFIDTDEGLTGIGESWGLPDPRVVGSIIENMLKPLLVGKDPLAIEQIWQKMYGSMQNGHLRGTLLEAMSGIDIALWDIKGKYLNLPVYRLLGGPVRERIETYASPVPFVPPREAAEKALEFTGKGFKTIKLKIGAGIKKDLEGIKAVREAVGPEIGIVTDANCGFTVPDAISLGRRLPEYDVKWLEEPVSVEDKAGLAEVRRAVDVAVVAGENEHTVFGILDLLQLRAVDAVQVNITRCGGITGARKIAELAGAFKIPMAPHGVGSAVGVTATLHLLSAVQNCMIYEYNQLLNPLRDDLLTEPLDFREGYLHAPEKPGLGIELKKDLIKKYAAAK